jgi:hypothetical protein
MVSAPSRKAPTNSSAPIGISEVSEVFSERTTVWFTARLAASE